jgi:glycine cleavage system H protein
MAKQNPTDRKYSKDHEWARDNGDATATVGITDHAQEMLTDIVFVELPALGKKARQGEPMAVVESVKSVSDVYAPLSGEIVAVNKKLEEQPDLVNQDAFGDGWIARIKMDDPAELGNLMDAAAYEAVAAADKH